MYLFFDTETTGLPKNPKAPASDTDNWPRLVQVAWLVYDRYGMEIDGKNFIIQPDGFSIPRPAAKVHGISTRRAKKEGIPVALVLEQFNEAVEKASQLVAHNMRFDEKIMGAEFIRAGIPTQFFRKKRFCTMLNSVGYCAIPGKRGGYKWPRLEELHTHLFGENFAGAHDAMADIQATARCYWKLRDKALI